MPANLRNLPFEQQIASIYIGYYNRAPDPFGAAHWERTLEMGGRAGDQTINLEYIADDFGMYQRETHQVYPFLADPTPKEIDVRAFITDVYLNLFNRLPDVPGLEHWTNHLLAGINNPASGISVGDFILTVIDAALDPANRANDASDGRDAATIRNKIDVAVQWTNMADEAGLTDALAYENNPEAQATGTSIIGPVTDVRQTATDAIAEITEFFTETPPNTTFTLTTSVDVLTGTDLNDQFNASEIGGTSNSLESGDHIDGGAGRDRLYAELTNEFVSSGDRTPADPQPTIESVEEIDLEASEGNGKIQFDAKDILGHVEIGSYRSDNDLIINNLTTLGANRNSPRDTSQITITMDHTDSFANGGRGGASNLEVYFDNDYLLANTEGQTTFFYYLLDRNQDGANNRLENIDVESLTLMIAGRQGPIEIELDRDLFESATMGPDGNPTRNHEKFVFALQNDLDRLIDLDLLPQGTTLTVNNDPNLARTDDGAMPPVPFTRPIPPIVLTIPLTEGGLTYNTPGFSTISEVTTEYNVFASPLSPPRSVEDVITVNVDLNKVGRGGEGGNLIIGGEANDTQHNQGNDNIIADGIERFEIEVHGDNLDPSNLGTIASTGDELREVHIETAGNLTDPAQVASLTVRNGFDERILANENFESGDLELINANDFHGHLTLGETPLDDFNFGTDRGRIVNADTITATGGGNVTLALLYNGSEAGISGGQADYRVTTGDGTDIIDVMFSGGSGQDYARTTITIETGAGDDRVNLAGETVATTIILEDDFGNDMIAGFTLGTSQAPTGFLDFTSYLNPTATNPVMFDGDNTNAYVAREMSVVEFTAGPNATQTFAGLDASDIMALFNGTAPTANYESLVAAQFVAGSNDGNAILMVENTGNDGEYKVFELTFGGSMQAQMVTDAEELGRLDFGASVELDAINLVGTAAFNSHDDGVA